MVLQSPVCPRWVHVRGAGVGVRVYVCKRARDCACVSPFSRLPSDTPFKTNVKIPHQARPLQEEPGCIYIDGNILYILYHCAYSLYHLV